MEFNEKLAELLKEIKKQEEQIEDIARNLEESGNLDESMEVYLENSREQLRKRKQELIEEFNPKASKLKIEITEGDESPVAKERPNTPSAFLNALDKYPLYSVHEIEVEKWSPIEREPKKHGSVRAPSPATTKCAPRKFSFPDNIDELSNRQSCYITNRFKHENKSQIQIYQEEQKKLIKEYQECRDIMIQAHETMLEIKERLLEIKEMEIESKLSQYKHSVNSKRGGFDLEDEHQDDKPPKKPLKLRKNSSSHSEEAQKILVKDI